MAEPRHRSFLFAPASSERIVARALESAADAVVLDLEDAVVPAAHPVAYAVLRDAAPAIARRPTHVRVSMRADSYSDDDLDLAVEIGAAAVRLPKASRPDELVRVHEVLDAAEVRHGGANGTTRIYPTIEDAAGLVASPRLAAATPRVASLVFGERDFMADMGVDEVGPLLDHARSTMAVVSRAEGIDAPVDGAFIGLEDDDGLRASAERARSLGFFGKSALHPRQLAIIHEVFEPSADAVEWAERIVAAYDASVEGGEASLTVDGQYVDLAVVRRATSILESIHPRGEQ